MKQRLEYYGIAPDLFEPLVALEKALGKSSLPKALIELVKIRASQINGCAHCLDMHLRDARAGGIAEQKLDVLAGFHESPIFDARERAALAWTEALTEVSQRGAPQEIYAQLEELFSDRERVDLTLAICAINSWNRVAIAFRTVHPVRASG
ncbi:MAG: carboxymuconolactone decarboxylase family protein [Nannocystales bacterium]